MFEFITDAVSRGGYIGIFLLMILENVFPPIPSELIMPLAGFTAVRGKLSVIGVLIAGTLGSVVGAVPWYYAAKMYGKQRLKGFADDHGRWLTISPDEIDRAEHLFDRHGYAVIFFGRLIPAIRTLISIPAGIARMPLLPFLALSTAGSLIWIGFLTAAGYILEANYKAIATYLDPVTKVIIGLIVAIYLYRLATHRKKRQS